MDRTAALMLVLILALELLSGIDQVLTLAGQIQKSQWIRAWREEQSAKVLLLKLPGWGMTTQGWSNPPLQGLCRSWLR